MVDVVFFHGRILQQALKWVRIPHLIAANKKEMPLQASLFCWQRMRDSTPRKRSQSPVCYRYTNPLAELLSEAHDYYNDLF